MRNRNGIAPSGSARLPIAGCPCTRPKERAPAAAGRPHLVHVLARAPEPAVVVDRARVARPPPLGVRIVRPAPSANRPSVGRAPPSADPTVDSSRPSVDPPPSVVAAATAKRKPGPPPPVAVIAEAETPHKQPVSRTSRRDRDSFHQQTTRGLDGEQGISFERSRRTAHRSFFLHVDTTRICLYKQVFLPPLQAIGSRERERAYVWKPRLVYFFPCFE